MVKVFLRIVRFWWAVGFASTESFWSNLIAVIALLLIPEYVWKVARYTSAAPVFFAECDDYVDGGVKANNPTTFGLAEIQEYLSNKYG